MKHKIEFEFIGMSAVIKDTSFQTEDGKKYNITVTSGSMFLQRDCYELNYNAVRDSIFFLLGIIFIKGNGSKGIITVTEL